MRDFKKLEIWKKAWEQYIFIKKNIIPKLPVEERYALATQMSKASLSIQLNIAEGASRPGDHDFSRFLDIALGSINETECCCLAAGELGYITQNETDHIVGLLNHLRSMTISFIGYLRRSLRRNSSES